MSTFTTRGDVTSCDRCGSETGPHWRNQAGHVCPRPRLVVRLCEGCDTPIHRRPDERGDKFRTRRFCTGSCAVTTTNKERA